jgi:hypothetical protein
MNGKFEEKLAELAFGDLSPEDAKRIEAQAMADPEAARALIEFRTMRSGLKDLHDVPEDQMSKERLRDAILAQGLKPQPERSPSPFGWLWMPATAAVLAAAFMLMRGGPSVEPTIVVDNSSVPDQRVALNTKPSVSDPVETPKVAVVRKPVVKTEPTTTVVRRERPRRKRKAMEPKMEFVEFSSAPQGYIARNDSKPDITRLPNTSVATETSSEPQDGPPIVMIEDNRDTTTGAFKATEVGASNVLIGG